VSDVTRVIEAAQRGDPKAVDELLPLVYKELRKLAASRMANEAAGNTLQPTALVHEAWMRLVGKENPKFAGRAHFFAAAAEAMRRILIEHARARGRVKRGGGKRLVRLPITVADLAAESDPDEILAVDGAIRRLEEEDATAAAVVRLRFFAGLTTAQAAEVLGVSERTVDREWTYARATLGAALGEWEQGG